MYVCMCVYASQATPRSAVPLPPVPVHKPLAGAPSNTESYLSPTELAGRWPASDDDHETAAAHDEGSTSAVAGAAGEVYENCAFSGDLTRTETIYANVTEHNANDSTHEDFVELY